MFKHSVYRVKISLVSACDADFDSLPPPDLLFSPGKTDEKISIAIKDDSIIEADEVFVVTLSTTNPNVKIDRVRGTTTVTITDNDGTYIQSTLFLT
jgi:hypothetical protein